MEIENLLVSGLRLRCAHEAAFFSAGVIPDEEILEDRSVFWENGADSSGVPDEQAKTDTGDDLSTSGRFTGNLSLSTCSWPPLHAWVGALLILLFENGLDEGYLDRRDRPPLKVILTSGRQCCGHIPFLCYARSYLRLMPVFIVVRPGYRRQSGGMIRHEKYGFSRISRPLLYVLASRRTGAGVFRHPARAGLVCPHRCQD